jgi:hypothetical protein
MMLSQAKDEVVRGTGIVGSVRALEDIDPGFLHISPSAPATNSECTQMNSIGSPQKSPFDKLRVTFARLEFVKSFW